MHDLIGLIIGHLYIMLKDILPGTHGYHIMKTPVFFKKATDFIAFQRNKHFNGGRPVPGTGAAAGQDNAAQQRWAAFGGRGVRLG